jgi:hypothetical protein
VIDIDLVERRFEQSRTAPSNLASTAPPRQGVYAIYAAKVMSVGGIAANDDGLLYVGKAMDGLRSRLCKKHFATGKSGTSTVRRSLGALLKKELRLEATPRAQGKTRKDSLNYRFTPDGEERLTAWMMEHLVVGFLELEADVRATEKMCIAAMCPPFNLQDWPNPQAAKIRKLRSVCADEADSLRLGSSPLTGRAPTIVTGGNRT